jgi:hypothetical protein
MDAASSSLYQGYRFPGEIISHCVWLYHQAFANGLRRRRPGVVKLLADKGFRGGVVNLFGSSSCRSTHGYGWGGSVGPRCRVSGGRGQSGDLVPRGESGGHLPAVPLSGETVTRWPEMRGYSAERGEESLRLRKVAAAVENSSIGLD